ncbi:class I SAM-dependent methyltransferase [Algoriphagus aestuarii]|nr:class I SAM-dependent methyltransferase [Algoriphagus aestuarii]
MKSILLNLFLIIGFIPVFSCQAQSTNSSEKDPYNYQTPSRDGTGKIYMGREISQVMGFQGKAWLERPNREEEEGISIALKNLPITEESIVADIGAGSGYYSFRIAALVPNGKVYAVEIQDEAISYLNDKIEDLKIENVETVKGSEKSPNLPEKSVDLAIMVDVYHELAYPAEILQNIYKSLKPNGKILLLEYRGEDPSINIKPLHKMTENQVKKELKANGFKFVKNGKFLPIQHFLIFEKAD